MRAIKSLCCRTMCQREPGAKETTKICLACSGWHYDHWRGVFYDTRYNYLDQYVRFFNSVEVNSTFYQFPTVSQLKNWYATTPDYFTFSIKMNRDITHTRRLHDVRRPLNDFLETCSVLGDKLGPFLIGLSTAFKKDLERFDEFLSILPEHRFAFEFRHSSWFDDEVFERFRAQRELILTMLGAQFGSTAECFADFAYTRWHARGRNGDGDSTSEIDYWARQIREISQRADVFGYWNNDAHGYAPQNCLQLTRKLASL